MRLLPTALLSALCFQLTWALHESDVGIVDWHKKLIGIPLTGSSATAPVFHRVGSETTRSVVLTATGSNVLAALEPKNGSVAWRYMYEPDDTIASFHAYDDVVASLSGPGGAVLRTFDALNGHLILERRLHDPAFGKLSEPNHLGTFVTFAKDAPAGGKDLFILTNGHTVQRLDKSGSLKWSWTSPDHSALVVYSRLIATTTNIYVVGLSKTPASYKLHISLLSPEDGSLLQFSSIPSSINDGLHDVLIIRHANETEASSTPRVVWLEQGSLKSIALKSDLQAKATLIKGSAYKRIADVGLTEHGRFVAVKSDGSSRIFRLEQDGSGFKSIWEFSESDNTHAEPIFTGGLDKKGQPYVARVRWSHVLQQVAVDVYTGHLGKGLMTGFTFPFDTRSHGIITHATLDCVNPTGFTVVSRLVITTSTGALQLWQQDKVQWTREESLSTISVAEFVELPEKVDSSYVPREREGFTERVGRQIMEAQGFPQYVLKFIRRFITGSYASASSSAVATDHSGQLSRDTFGFRQVIVAATPYSKVYGIDSSNGEILWSRMLGLGWAAETGGSIKPVKLYTIQGVNENEGGSTEVVLVTQRRAENTLIDTVIYHIDATTGKNVASGITDDGDVLQGVDVISGPLVESFILPGDTKVIVLLDEFLQVYLYPDTQETKAAFTKLAPSLHFPLRVSVEGQRRLVGHQVSLNSELSGRYVANPTWTLSLSPKEDIQTLISARKGIVASYGKVLGNRTTLYKYLNPRIFVLLTTPKSAINTINSDKGREGACGVYLVDSGKGSILYKTSVPAHDGACDVYVNLVENWLVIHYYEGDFHGVGQSKGWRVVTVELYEGLGVDDKTKSSEISAFSEKITDLTAFEQSYVFPYGITALSTTMTKYGISTKDLVVATRNNKIVSIPRRLLNPRRPNRKITSEEQEEMLIPYDPIIPDDSRRTLSHNCEVASIRHILTAPSLLESTSLVFAFGLDLFFTRVAPSNTFDVLSENFNKGQLVVTVVGLVVAIMVTRPMVKRKWLRERWYQ